MKKLIFGLLTALMMTVSLSSCDKLSVPRCACDEETPVAEQIELYNNPAFLNVNDVVLEQQRLLEKKTIDEVFLAMPEKVLVDASTVCFKKFQTVSKGDIVNEYLSHRDVYDNLPQPANSAVENKPDTPANPVQEPQQITPPPAEQQVIRVKVDTINGKPVKILVEEYR